ncbi:MAG: hypothetical protein ACLQHL_15290 [Candidatus Cybelea sp.]
MMNKLILLVACLAFAASGPAQASNATTVPSATVVVRNFYGWYLVQPNHEWTAHLSQIKATFDPNLYTMLQTVLHSKANQEEPIIDFDPFVNAQWDATSYVLGRPVVKGTEVRIPVTLNPAGRPNPKTTLIAILRTDASGRWVIYNFIYDATFNLRDFLRKQLKNSAS